MAVVRIRRGTTGGGEISQLVNAFLAGSKGVSAGAAGGDGGDGGPAPVDVAAASATGAAASPNPWFVIGSVVAVGAYWLIFVASRAADFLRPHDAATIVSGVSVFALFYAAAQAIERLIEPFASLDPWKKQKTVDRDCAVVTAVNGSGTPIEDAQDAADKQGALDEWRANRAVSLWAVATILGMAASALLGMYFLAAIESPHPDVNLDILFTGLVVGGGTKPLHDLISRVQSSATAAKDSTTVVS